jgi:hypothetical protein
MRFGALGLAGLFTLLPGRRLNGALFPAEPGPAWAAIALGGAFLPCLGSRLRQGPSWAFPSDERLAKYAPPESLGSAVVAELVDAQR